MYGPVTSYAGSLGYLVTLKPEDTMEDTLDSIDMEVITLIWGANKKQNMVLQWRDKPDQDAPLFSQRYN